MKLFSILALAAGSLFAQGMPCDQVACVDRFFYTGSSLQYQCTAEQKTGATYQRRSDSTLTNIVDSSNIATATTASAHGLYPGAQVVISGVVADTDLNGTYTIQTVPSDTTYTITTANVTDATYTDATMVITTTYPLLTATRWKILVLTYEAAVLTGKHWANQSTVGTLACTARTSY